ncbi:TPA: hypothetical protein EYP70_06140 [Candidatus Bathyarchaeota archaeon]|nr:hypothetical protein [Candidatus Bathyarchaeota archaeon]
MTIMVSRLSICGKMLFSLLVIGVYYGSFIFRIDMLSFQEGHSGSSSSSVIESLESAGVLTSGANYTIKTRTVLAYARKPCHGRSIVSGTPIETSMSKSSSFWNGDSILYGSKGYLPLSDWIENMSTFILRLEFPEGVELLTNPNVEEGSSGPSGWRVWPSDNPSTSWSTEEAYSLIHSLEINLKLCGSVSWYSEVFRVEEGRTYMFSGYFKGSIRSGRWHLSILWYKNRDKTGYLGYNTVRLRSSAEWMMINSTAIAPEEARYATLEFWVENGTGIMYGDDFSVKDVSRILNVKAGSSGFLSFKVESVNGYNGTVKVTARGVSISDLKVSVNPNCGHPPFNGTVKVYVDPKGEGEYILEISATDGRTEKTEELRVWVPYYTFKVEPSTIIAFNGSRATAEVYVSSHYRFNDSISIEVSHVPAYVKYRLEPSRSGYGDFTRKLLFEISGNAAFKTEWINVTARSGLKAKNVTLNLAVVFLKIAASKTVLYDESGLPMVNPDGTYYPGDAFSLKVKTCCKNLRFEFLEFNYQREILDGPTKVFQPNCSYIFKVRRCVKPRDYTLNVIAYCIYMNVREPIMVKTSVQIDFKVVEYNPKFTVLAMYIQYWKDGDSTFRKPIAAIVRYNGNGPEFERGKRALLHLNFTWTGYATKTPNTTRLNFRDLWLQTAVFTVVAPEEFWSLVDEAVLKVDNTEFKVADLPLKLQFPRNGNITYEWSEEILNPADPTVRYVYKGCLGDQYRSGILEPSLAGQLIAAVYAPEKSLLHFPHEKPAVKLVGEMKSPILFTDENRYAEILMVLDEKLADNVAREGWNEIYLELNFTECRFTKKPRAILTLNYTIYHFTLVQPFIIEAVKPIDETFITDVNVYINVTFKPVGSSLWMESAARWLQIIDPEAAEIFASSMREDRSENFSGYGSINGTILLLPGAACNISVHIKGYGTKIDVSWIATLPFNPKVPYRIYVNMVGGGINVYLVRNSPAYLTLKIEAKPQSGGVVRIRIYNWKGKLIRIIDVQRRARNPAFIGNYTLTIAKGNLEGKKLTLEIENMWGAKTIHEVYITEYERPAWTIEKEKVAYYLTILLFALIVTNMIIYLLKEHLQLQGKPKSPRSYQSTL